MTNKTTIYFPRVKQYFTPSEDISLNAYLNLFRYVKNELSEELLDIIAGGEIPLIKNGSFIRNRLNRETNISYVMGIYYEEFHHDYDENLRKTIIKNLKMRIAVPIIKLKSDTKCIRNQYLSSKELNDGLPVLCCGCNESKEMLVIINPVNGEYAEVGFDDIHKENNQRKMYMLNVPGMIKMYGITEKDMIRQAIGMYTARFFRLKSCILGEYCGYEAFKWIGSHGMYEDDKIEYKHHLAKQKKWITKVRERLDGINGDIGSNLQEIDKLYDGLISDMEESYYWRELNGAM